MDASIFLAVVYKKRHVTHVLYKAAKQLLPYYYQCDKHVFCMLSTSAHKSCLLAESQKWAEKYNPYIAAPPNIFWNDRRRYGGKEHRSNNYIIILTIIRDMIFK